MVRQLEEHNKLCVKDLELLKLTKFKRKIQNCRTTEGVVWDLAYEDIVWSTHCPVLGIKLDYFAEKKIDESPSFYRLLPELGYVKGNVIITSYRATWLKSLVTIEELRALLRFIDNPPQK